MEGIAKLNITYMISEPFYDIDDAHESHLNLMAVQAVSTKRKRTSRLVKGSNQLYYIESLSINDEEYKDKFGALEEEEVVQILARISETLSQAAPKGD